ncbi:MFS general substrate transporter [Lophiostoma macrostomum CBS 122681]|uniref:MFS general substrate transporter n=1 Tax=Lophiostoma macrostomum CBS 122681 TaxID=1314788 RepID=A0A6A6SY03_9PLEO|nr:MFS general substrate transporter [Lophiostoma macrostomum CBS 122681]
MISLSVISLAVALDATILVSVLPTIAKALHGSSTDAFWAGTAYLLSSAVFQPVIASTSELFGRQQLLLVSLFFFTLGSILCAVAGDFRTLFVGRSIQGIGGGGIITSSQIIFCDLVPLRQRPKYFGMVLGSWSLGSIIGPVLGGAICENTTWRWVFYINFPFCVIGIMLALLFVRMRSKSTDTLLQKLRQVDWFGSVLFLGGSTTALVGLSWGGVQYPWTSAQTLLPIIIGFSLLAAFIFWQKYMATYTLLPMSLFQGASALAAFYSALVNGLILYTALYYWPFYFMAVRSDSPVRAGIDLFPALFSLLPGSILVSALTSRFGRFRWAIWSGWVLSTFGCGLAIFAAYHDNKAVWAITLFIFGIGSGMVLTSVNVAIQAISRVEDSAMAASMYGFMRSLGMPIGIVVSGTVFQNAMSSKLKALALPTDIAHDSERYIYVLREMAMNDPKRLAILEAYKYGFRSVWVMATVVSATGLVTSLVIKRFNMDKILASKFSARNEA